MQTDAVIAANRFGLGARPGDLDRIAPDPRRWLLGQLDGSRRPPAPLEDLPHSSAVLTAVQNLRRGERQQKRASEDDPAAELVRLYGRTVREHYVDQAIARYRAAVLTDAPFHERLVHFWSNHFAVSADKQPLPAIAGLYENEAIRPNVTGRFADLLIAAVRHPAMILYLDNQRSIGPASPAARRANRSGERSIGLNENLAREILELHTLGVDGGYSQADVTAFAAVITGWSIGGAGPDGRFAEGTPGMFAFRDAIHEPGAKIVLGKRYRQDGLAQGEAVLRDLAAHPATADSIAAKLARHFVCDEPPPVLVSRLAGVFLDSGGELAEVYAALIQSREAWQQVLAKYKSPHDLVISTCRALEHEPEDRRFVIGALDLMGQAPFRPGSPEGWPDTAAQWGGADALYKRIEWCNTVARVVAARIDPAELGDAVLGSAFRRETRTAVGRAESASQGTTLLFASPDFQRR
jgi:uncharacterized protein (DUF1800 family)